MELTHRTVLITGGTSGIGLEMARQLMSRGNAVIVTGRDPAQIEAARAALPGLHAIRSDVADPDAVTDLHRQVLAEFPDLDILVNNAGVMRNLNLNRAPTLPDLTQEIDIGLAGPIRMIQQFLPHLKARAGAAIINVTSGLAFTPFPSAPVYSAAKAGLHALAAE